MPLSQTNMSSTATAKTHHASFLNASFFWVVILAFAGGLFCSTVPEAMGEEGHSVRLVGFNYPPFYLEQETGIEGIAMDLAKQLFARLDLVPEMSVYPLKRALTQLERGDADATMILIKTPERSQYLHFTEPVAVVRGLIWSRAGRKGGVAEFDRLEDLRPYKTGVTRGYSYGNELDALLPTMDVEVANTDYQNYLMLLSGRIDIFPGNEIVAEGLFKEHPELRGKFTHSKNSFIEWVLRIGVSKKSPLADKIQEINAIISELHRDGTIDSIIKKYTK